MALKVTVFSDFVCPFCYIGLETMRKLAPEFGVDLQWRGFEIHPEWPAEGIEAEKVYARMMSPQARAAVWQRISAMAEAVGVRMTPPARLTNSHAALMAAEYAQEEGRGEVFERSVYRAYFEEGANIGDIEVLKKLGAEAGLAPELVAEAARSPKYDLKLKNNALVASRHGVTGVPTFFIGDFPLVGAQSEDVMRQILARASQRLASQQ
jgi:predicted DsbA family dithiol-disulfide isomerase